MSPTVTVDYSGFMVMATELSTLSGKTYADVVKSEAASSIKIAALESPIASAPQITKSVTERLGSKFVGSGGIVSVNVKNAKGRVWFDQGTHSRAERVEGPSRPGERHLRRVVKHGDFYMIFDAGPTVGHHVPDPIWNEYLVTAGERAGAIRARVAELKARRGLERKSWLQMGDAMGVSLASVAPQGNLREDVARDAAVHGHTYENGSAIEQSNGPEWSVTITNTSPVAVKRKGQDRLDRARNRRVKAFEFAAQKGFLDDLQFRARRWPGIFVTAA